MYLYRPLTPDERRYEACVEAGGHFWELDPAGLTTLPGVLLRTERCVCGAERTMYEREPIARRRLPDHLERALRAWKSSRRMPRRRR